MRLLITGASGFIGRNLVRAVPRDWRVTATWHLSADFPAFVASESLHHVTAARVDLTGADADTIARTVGREHDAIVFLAANGDPAVSVERPRHDLAANALSLVALLEAVRAPRLLFMSSGAVYDGLEGDVHPGVAVSPALPYAVSKLTAEHYARFFVKSGRLERALCVRFFGAYGPHEPARKLYTRLVRAFGEQGARSFTVRGDGRNLIDAMYVDDAVRAVITLLADSRGGSGVETLDLASGSPVTIEQLVLAAGAVFGIRPEIAYSGAVPEYIRFRSVDTAMRERYGFRPAVDLTDGLQRLARHLGCASGAGHARP